MRCCGRERELGFEGLRSLEERDWVIWVLFRRGVLEVLEEKCWMKKGEERENGRWGF